MPAHIDRRHLLTLGLGAVAWACAKGTKAPSSSGTTEAPGPGDSAYSIVPTTPPQGALVIGDTRTAFAVFRGSKPTNVDDVAVKLVPPNGRAFSVEAPHASIERGPGGKGHQHTEATEVTDIWVVRHDFDTAGVWELDVTFKGGRGKSAFQVGDTSDSPTVGKKAIASQSPTASNHRGVDPICTRDPVCSLHDRTIADALSRGKPSVLVFATPRFCESRTCGPVVDFVEDAKKKYGDAASFIHIEEWKDDKQAPTKGELAPVWTEWKFQTEPWIYFVKSDGTVRDRWLGAAGGDEIAQAVKSLIKHG